MEVNLQVKPGQRIRAFYLFFIISSIEVGDGFLRAPSYMCGEARPDAWLFILIAFVYIIIVAWVMFIILNQYKNTDIFGIQVDIFGKWIGKLLGTIYIVFFAAELLSVLLTYVEIVQIFLYPTIPTLVMGLILMILVVYSVLGGIRVIVGVEIGRA